MSTAAFAQTHTAAFTKSASSVDLNATNSSIDDLLGLLDATTAAGIEADAIRADRGPKIPKLEHVISYEWRPPPSREEVLKTVSSDNCHSRRFNRTTKHNGDAFRKEGILQPKVLGQWHHQYTTNCVPDRSISRLTPYKRPGLFRYHGQSEPIEEPTDEMLHEQHRTWLEKHRTEREKHLHPIYHALIRVEKAVEKEKDVQKKRETTTDLMTRESLVKPKFNAVLKGKLQRAQMAVKTSRAFKKLQGIDSVADEDKKNKAAFERVFSDPILEHKPSTPPHRARHLRSWKGPDRRQDWTQIDNCFKHTTPGVSKQEERELHEIPKYRARGAPYACP